MKKNHIQNANIKVIEAELKSYKQSLAWLDEMRNEIIDSTPNKELSSGGKMHPDPTASKVIKLSSVAIRETERRVDAITYMLDVLKNHPDSSRTKMVELKYFKGLSEQRICYEINIDRSTYFRWRKQCIEIVAERLGFLV